MINTMKTERIQYLLKKYLSHNCSQAEKKELNFLIDTLQDKELKAEFRTLWINYSSEATLSEEDSQYILTNILSNKKTVTLTQRRKPARPIYFRAISVAASLLILISVGIYLKNENSKQGVDAVVAKAVLTLPEQATSYIRNITLADGSMVILQKGSTIKVNSDFGNKKREIALTGEAYFDIKHDAKRPFIIHTGAVKTTVLGTAFNIKAWPNQKNVVVLVTRGKVKVEKQEKTLAFLTKNMQLKVLDQENEPAEIVEVAAEKIVTNWTHEDLIFTNTSFDNITKVLSKRYGVNITIKDEELSKSLIVTSFSGRESLSSVLNVLCSLHSGVHYTTTDEQEIAIERN